MEDEEMADSSSSSGDRCRGFSVDFDYEYDAPKFFDLSAEEPVMEASSAEKWFDTAESYPPSPLIMKIACEEEMFSDSVYHDAEAQPSELTDVTEEETQCRLIENVTKVGDKPKVKSYASKVSTLMKPTASYLAKKTQRHETAPLINKLNTFKSLESSGEAKDCTFQAPKRQRLEKGHLSKAIGTVQPDLIHKTRDKTDIAHANGNVGPARLRLTIPKEPDLQTTRRAERLHARRGLINVNEPHKQRIRAEATHKPNSSNKNVVEFHLMNKSRVLGGLPGALSKAVEGCDRVFKKSENRNSQNPQPYRSNVNQKHEGKSSIFFFKAETADKKVAPFSSRNRKPESTVPKEHNLYTSRRQQNPPPLTEVFNKLSLATGARHVSTSKTPFFVPPAHVSKESKENIRINHLRC